MTRTTTPLALFAVLLLPAMAACTGSAATAQHGYVTGKVVDRQGQPIAGAKILLKNAVFSTSSITATSQADGSYRIKVEPSTWKASASFKQTYNGRTYVLELVPDNHDSFSDDGAVRNFTWQLEGRDPGNEYRYYGGLIAVIQATGWEGSLEDVELTLTPDGPLIDGSPGQTLHLRMGGKYWDRGYSIEDVPMGRYKVTAMLNNADSTRPLRIVDFRMQGKQEPQREYQLDFIPNPPDGIDNSASIVIGD